MEMLSLKSYCVFTPAVFSLMNSMNALSDVLTHCFSKWNPSEHFLIPTKWRRRHRSICSSWATSCVKSQTFTLRLRFMLSRELGRLSTLCLRREAVDRMTRRRRWMARLRTFKRKGGLNRESSQKGEAVLWPRRRTAAREPTNSQPTPPGGATRARVEKRVASLGKPHPRDFIILYLSQSYRTNLK